MPSYAKLGCRVCGQNMGPKLWPMKAVFIAGEDRAFDGEVDMLLLCVLLLLIIIIIHTFVRANVQFN